MLTADSVLNAVGHALAWIMELPPFLVPIFCAKCGGADHTVRWQEHRPTGLDYLLWTCGRCGYVHATRCADTNPQGV